jgi:hypothetical protein
MKLRARSRLLSGQVVTATVISRGSSPLVLQVTGPDGQPFGELSAEAALADYEVIEASADERHALQRAGHLFGGVQ